jgi:inner membrane protein YidH
MNEDRDASRRTRLALERTWLAWWRTGLAVSVAALAVGRIAPHLLHYGRGDYGALGFAYVALAVAIFGASYLRYRAAREALERGGYDELSVRWVAGFAIVGVALALATLALILLG